MILLLYVVRVAWLLLAAALALAGLANLMQEASAPAKVGGLVAVVIILAGWKLGECGLVAGLNRLRARAAQGTSREGKAPG